MVTPNRMTTPGDTGTLAGSWALWRYRELAVSLLLREIKARYKQTVVGIAWAALQPLALMLMFTVVFTQFARVPTEGLPYPIFALSALVPWTFLAGAVSRGTTSLVSNQSLITKVYFPRHILPLSTAAAGLVDFVIGCMFLGLLLGYYGIPLTTCALMLVPIFGVQLILLAGLVLLLAPVNVFFRDIGHLVPLALQLWMFASPILYPLSAVPDRWRVFYLLNPLAGIVDSYRKVLLHGVAPDVLPLYLASLVSFVVFLLGWLVLQRLEPHLADVI